VQADELTDVRLVLDDEHRGPRVRRTLHRSQCTRVNSASFAAIVLSQMRHHPATAIPFNEVWTRGHP
jgi:hypothetical protein